MSLLMDALKKAERTKQEHADQPGEALEMQPPQETLDFELSLEPTEHRSTPNAHEKKEPSPVISVPGSSTIPDLTLMSDPAQDDTSFSSKLALDVNLAEPAAAKETATKHPESPSPNDSPAPRTSAHSEIEPRSDVTAKPSTNISERPAPATRNNRETPVLDGRKIAIAQKKAKSMFAAKQPARSHAALLTGAAAAILIGGAAFGIYYWNILSNNSSTLPTHIPPQAALQTPQSAPATPVADNSIPSSNGEPLPHAADVAPPQASLRPDSTPSQTATGASAPPPEEKPVPTPHSGNPAIQIRQSKATNQLNPTLSKAYQSFLAGDIEMAQQQYKNALQQEPNNRDALLGLAAIALNRKQPGQATAYYLKLLDLNPTDPEALAGLVGLQGQADPGQSESRLKKILTQNPQAAALHFALGNVYTQQSRWAEAQQSYFRAYSIAPNNADYAYNLAISLDHLGQGKLALEYYQRAIALSKSGPANFDKAAAQDRDMELQQSAGN